MLGFGRVNKQGKNTTHVADKKPQATNYGNNYYQGKEHLDLVRRVELIALAGTVNKLSPFPPFPTFPTRGVRGVRVRALNKRE